MELLSVITVPSAKFDGTYHTAFTVYDSEAEALRTTAGWTLRDAIEHYAQFVDEVNKNMQ